MDDAADTEFFVEDAYNDAARLERKEEQEAPDTAPVAPADDGMTDGGESVVQPTSDEKEKSTVVHLFGEEAARARAALTEMGRGPDAVQDIADVYELTAEEADALRKLVPDVIEAEGALYLTLEVVR